MEYVLHLIVLFQLFAIVAMSLNLLVGYCGLLTLAHSGFFALGAYGYAILGLTTSLGFVPLVAAGVAISVVCSLSLSVLSWRLRGDFFVLGSLALQTFIYTLIYNWTDTKSPLGSLSNLTNGSFGIPNIPPPSVLGYSLDKPGLFVPVSTVAFFGCFLFLRHLQRAGWSQMLFALRDDELAARGLGKNTRLLKLEAVAISAALAALAGALYAAYAGFVDPTNASLDDGILVLCMVLIGGLGTLRGSVVGAAVLIVIPEVLRLLQIEGAQAGSVRLCLYGLAILLMMRFRPQGLVGSYRLD